MERIASRPAAEIDVLLQQKRKGRETKACYPCRKRKVRCDNLHPCHNCIRREHVDLCLYNVETGHVNRPTLQQDTTGKRKREEEAVGQGSSLYQGRPLQRAYDNDSEINRQVQSARLRGNQPGVTPAHFGSHGGSPRSSVAYLGGNSLPTFVLNHSTPEGAASGESPGLEQDILPMLGLSSTSAYPFMQDPSIVPMIQNNPRGLLPSDKEIMTSVLPRSTGGSSLLTPCRTFYAYRNVAYPFNPIIVDIDEFESDLCAYLDERHPSEDTGVNGLRPQKELSMGWMGLLLAVMASGTQFSTKSRSQRETISQAYGKFVRFSADPQLQDESV